MVEQLDVLALDIGAESGRAILCHFDGNKLEMEEVHRFENISVRTPDGLHWGILYLFNEIKKGIRKAKELSGERLQSVGIDTWGVDYGLLDKDDSLCGLPYHYRDSRTDGIFDKAFEIVSRKDIFAQTGNQFMQFNSLFQLLEQVQRKSSAIDAAKTFLTIPDLLNFFLTGRKVCEFTNATTTQCLDPRTGEWATDLLEQMGIPSGMFPEIVPAGTILGELLPAVAEETNADGLTVIAPACHDTGSAVAAVPAVEKNVAFLSSGTWSLIGMEVEKPVLTDDILAMNFTNEGCIGGHYRLLKNITGLWIVQECRRHWKRHGEDLNYVEITQMAAEAAPLKSFIDTDYGEFMKPNNMPEKIQAFCKQTGQPVPQTKGEIVRCALESLAMKYRDELTHLEAVAGHELNPLHIVGGGTQNKLLNQFTANSIQRQVVTGPVEATAAGNILAQLMALGKLSSIEEARQVIRNSFEMEEYQPQDAEVWNEAYTRYQKILG
ncbi:MAG: rhamnulokinase [Anaerolineaceae bacterium]|nr:rhamnulokinase [Anaerolineaceae bacterium]